jgi:N-acyl-D-aspartate/D-glutamate deacylase
MTLDILIRNGIVIDGTGTPPRRADIGIKADRIAAIDRLDRAIGELVIDASGRIVAPGFIDSHTHSDLAWRLGPAHIDLQAATVRQGVTTEICGNCGFSPFPFAGQHRADLERHVGALFGASSTVYESLTHIVSEIEGTGIYTNLAPLVGHGSVRVGAFGFESRAPSHQELQQMKLMVAESFERGALGLSSGLVYVPGAYARTEELIQLMASVAPYGRPYVSHIRGETDMVAESVREAIQIGRQAGTPIHISHHKAAGRSNWGRTEETLEIIDGARRAGTDVTIDVYPYTAGSTLLYATLPSWAQEGGVPHIIARLRESATRDRIRAEWESGLPGWENLARAAGWDGISIATCAGRAETEGRSIADLATDAGKAPADYTFDLLVEQSCQVTVILHTMIESDVSRVLGYPAAMVGSDGIPLPGKPHPRWAGTFSRVLGRYSRDQHLFDLTTAVHKMTELAANRFGLRSRGTLTAHEIADIVIFSADTVIDRATFDRPLEAPIGINDVLVNGTLVVYNGQLTGNKPGRVLVAE